MNFELNVKATVTLDATPTLVGALDRVADAFKGDGKAPAKPRAKAAKTPEPEAAGELAAQPTAAVPPTATPAAAPVVPPATPAPASSTSKPATPSSAPIVAPASPASAAAAKGMPADQARRILIAIVQKHACSDALQAKLHELGYQTQFTMPDDVRADFVAWARQTYPISDAEVM